MERVYLDNAATTPLCDAAAHAMEAFLRPGCEAPFGNANSLHSIGRDAFMALEDARMRVCRALQAQRPDEIIFTSGATEADNAALIGLSLAGREKSRRNGGRERATVVMSRIEHDAVLHTERMLRELGFSVRFVRNSASGRISPDALREALDETVVLVSIMAANNEVGTVEPIEELARVAHAGGALFHTDAVQALGKIDVPVRAWGVDAASFSAHKVGGPKGVGVLYLRAGTPLSPLMAGGGQERGMRSGTQNVAGIVGCAAAFEHAVSEQRAFAARTRALRDELYASLCARRGVVPSVSVPRGSEDFLPHMVNVCVRGVESQTMILQFDLKGFCVSGGSACSSNSLDPSHVLSALGIERNLAQGSLRISMGQDTTPNDIEAFIRAFAEVLA